MVAPFFRTVRPLAWLLLGVAQAVGVRAEEPVIHPHPVIAWPSDPFEVRVAFARPLDEGVARRVVGRLIPFEEDASVIAQAKPRRPSRDVPHVAHRGSLRVAAARLEDEGRTLLLVTDPHPRVGTYSLHLIGIRGPGQPEPGESIDLLYG